MTHEWFVQAIRQQLKVLGMTPYRLHQLLGGTVNRQTVYNLLTHGRPVHSDILAAVMHVVGLTVAPVAGDERVNGKGKTRVKKAKNRIAEKQMRERGRERQV